MSTVTVRSVQSDSQWGLQAWTIEIARSAERLSVPCDLPADIRLALAAWLETAASPVQDIDPGTWKIDPGIGKG
jgi:hypothetical protein